jgi:hypothetical protein
MEIPIWLMALQDGYSTPANELLLPGSTGLCLLSAFSHCYSEPAALRFGRHLLHASLYRKQFAAQCVFAFG